MKNIGDRGWIAYVGEKVLHVEYLGEGTQDCDWPGKPYKYWRLLENGKSDYEDLLKGRVLTTTENERDETVLHPTRKAALQEAVAYLEAWDERTKKEKNRYGEEAAKLRELLEDEK